jgi:Na+/H+-translocating membrane pyrophosphatase
VAADLFESTVITLLSALLLGRALGGGAPLGTYPLALGATGFVASVQFTRLPASNGKRAIAT